MYIHTVHTTRLHFRRSGGAGALGHTCPEEDLSNRTPPGLASGVCTKRTLIFSYGRIAGACCTKIPCRQRRPSYGLMYWIDVLYGYGYKTIPFHSPSTGTCSSVHCPPFWWTGPSRTSHGTRCSTAQHTTHCALAPPIICMSCVCRRPPSAVWSFPHAISCKLLDPIQPSQC